MRLATQRTPKSARASSAPPLLLLQQAIARILMEPGQVEAFRADPHAYARRAGLKGKHADLLAGMHADGAAYFASRRTIDRRHYLGADLPRSVDALDATVGLEAYFAAQPYAYEEPDKEVRQVLGWAKAAARAGTLPQAVADLVAIEANATLLMRRPARKPARAAASQGKTGTRTAGKPGKPRRGQVKLLTLGTDPDVLLSEGVDAAMAQAPARHVAALHREPDDVEVYRLQPQAAALLRAANGKRTEAELVQHVAAKHGAAAARASLRDLRRIGLLE